jgi:hypothetical protein
MCDVLSSSFIFVGAQEYIYLYVFDSNYVSRVESLVRLTHFMDGLLNVF